MFYWIGLPGSAACEPAVALAPLEGGGRPPAPPPRVSNPHEVELSGHGWDAAG
jgi:hypothetical protein